MTKAACGCAECLRSGAPVEAGEHRFTLETDDYPDAGGRWRWVCGCKVRALGRWQYQSPWVAYHAWREHVARSLGAAEEGS